MWLYSLGVTRMTAVIMREHTMQMTSRAIRIPRQFLWVGLLPTSSYKEKTDREPLVHSTINGHIDRR